MNLELTETNQQHPISGAAQEHTPATMVSLAVEDDQQISQELGFLNPTGNTWWWVIKEKSHFGIFSLPYCPLHNTQIEKKKTQSGNVLYQAQLMLG